MRKFTFRWLLSLLVITGFAFSSNAQYLTEDFENGGAFPAGWTLTNGTDDWAIDQGNDYGPGSAQEGTYCAFFNDYDYSSGTVAEMISPNIDLSSATAPLLDFWYYDGGGSDDVEVLISTDGSTYTSLYTTNTTVSPWTELTVDLSAYVGQATVTLSFKGTSVYGTSNPHIDNVVVREISTENDILTYSFPGDETGPATIDATAHTVNIEVAASSDITALVATFSLSDYASAAIGGTAQVSGTTSNDFSSAVTYDVTAEDGTTIQPWTITVTQAAVSSENDITAYSFAEETGAATIDATAHTVAIEVDWQADLTSLVATFSLSAGASTAIGGTAQVSGTTANDFSAAVTYDVTAEDGTTVQPWTITVTQAAPPAGATCSSALPVSLPTDFVANIYEDLSQTNVGLANWNDTTSLGSYDGGEDIFYELTVTSDITVNVELDPKGTTYTGIGIYDGCPGNTNEIAKSTNGGGTAHGMNTVFLAAGTYYIMIDTWPSPNNIPDFDLTITYIPCPDPTALGTANLTASSVDLTWTTGGASNWDIEWDVTGFTPTGTPTINDTPNNPYSLTGLTPETTYDFYVRDDCGADNVDTSNWVGPFSFTTTAACPAPSDLAASTTDVTASLSWNGYAATNWDIEWDVTGFTPTGTPTINDTPNNPESISGLTAQTAYDFYVRADCGSDNVDTSVWVGPFTFTTTCPSVSSYPYFEGFEDANMPSCWTVLNEDADAYEWSIATDSPFEGSQITKIHWNTSGNDDWLISPRFSITEDNLMVDFQAKSQSSSWLEDYNVLVSTTGTNPADFTTVLENVTSAPNAWTRKIYDLTGNGINIGDEIYVAIQCVSNDEFYLQIDAFSVRPINTETDFLTYSFAEETATITPDATNHTIDIEVAYGTDPSALVATYTLSDGATANVGGTAQESGVTANTFVYDSPFTYNVVAEDGTTNQDWIITVSEKPASTEKAILTYTNANQTGPATIDAGAFTVDLEVGNGTDLTAIVADFTLSDFASAAISGTAQESGVTSNDFTSGALTYTITAEDGSTQDWIVTVTEATINDETDILTYSFSEETGAATIDATAHTVNIEVNWQADLTSLTATFTLSYGATTAIGGTAQVSGTTANDFSSAVTYDVTAEDGTTAQAWTITVTQEAAPQGLTCGNPFTYTNINDAAVNGHIDLGVYNWYTVVLDQDYVNVSFNTCGGTAGDTRLWVYDACNGTELGYNDDDCGTRSTVTFSTLAAGTYYVAIDEYGQNDEIDYVFEATGTMASDAEILTYTIPAQVSSEIFAANDSISVVMPEGTDVTALIADFTLSTNATVTVATVDQVSGTTPNDWTTNPVDYVVLGEDGITTRTWHVWVTLATGINTILDSKDVTVYPNPNNGQFNISLNLNINKVNMEIVNTLGQVVAEFNDIDANTTQSIELSNIAEGIYYIRISSNNNTIIKKVNIVK